MHISSLLRRSSLALVLAVGSFATLPTTAQAFLFSDNTALFSGALDTVAYQTGRKIIVLNKKGGVVSSTCGNVDANGKPIANAKGHIYVNNLRTGELYPEIKKTLTDGVPRSFGAKGPDGQVFKKTINAVRNGKQIVGAVLVITPLKN